MIMLGTPEMTRMIVFTFWRHGKSAASLKSACRVHHVMWLPTPGLATGQGQWLQLQIQVVPFLLPLPDSLQLLDSTSDLPSLWQKKIFFLAALGGPKCSMWTLRCSMRNLVPWPRDQTRSPCFGSMRSWPLDCQGSLTGVFFFHLFLLVGG